MPNLPFLTHFVLAYYKRDTNKQCRTRSDTAFRIYTVCIKTGISIKQGNTKNQLDIPSTGDEPVQRFKVKNPLGKKG